jgi:hypothetical protein
MGSAACVYVRGDVGEAPTRPHHSSTALCVYWLSLSPCVAALASSRVTLRRRRVAVAIYWTDENFTFYWSGDFFEN